MFSLVIIPDNIKIDSRFASRTSDSLDPGSSCVGNTEHVEKMSQNKIISLAALDPGSALRCACPGSGIACQPEQNTKVNPYASWYDKLFLQFIFPQRTPVFLPLATGSRLSLVREAKHRGRKRIVSQSFRHLVSDRLAGMIVHGVNNAHRTA